MAHQDQDFAARMNRVRAQSKQLAPMPDHRSINQSDFDEHAVVNAILLPQFALVLGAVAMIVGRSISMNYLSIDPSADVLSLTEGAIVMFFLVLIGLLFGKSEWISHAALVIGAALAFLCEPYFIPLVPDVMSTIYNPGYVALVLLNA